MILLFNLITVFMISDAQLGFTSPMKFFNISTDWSTSPPRSASGSSWSESHLSVLRWIMSGATVGTKVRTQQLSKHQLGYRFQSGCWPHLRVNTVLLVTYQTDIRMCKKGKKLLTCATDCRVDRSWLGCLCLLLGSCLSGGFTAGQPVTCWTWRFPPNLNHRQERFTCLSN